MFFRLRSKTVVAQVRAYTFQATLSLVCFIAAFLIFLAGAFKSTTP